MESPTDHNNSYIPSTEAASRFGLTNDHIASLCRRGKVEGTLVGGRLWFVDETSLAAYLHRTQEERALRNRRLSEKIKSEYAAPKESAARKEKEDFSLKAFALAAYIVGSFYVGVPLAYEEAAQIPWEHLPQNILEVSADAYDRTFVATAETYVAFLNKVADVQADSYALMGESLAAASVEAFSERPLVALAAFPDALADTLITGWSEMAEWYAGGLVAAVHAYGNGQEYVMVAVYDTLEESTHSMGAAAAAALIDTGEDIVASAEELALWYAQGSAAVTERMSAAGAAEDSASAPPVAAKSGP